jgi:hypothetical protein
MPFPSKLSYAAFLNYSPRGVSRVSQVSRVFRDAIKNDGYVSITKDGKTESVRGIAVVVARLREALGMHSFLRECLSPQGALVPIPRSAPLANKDALWPSRRICEDLVAAGLGAEVTPLLKRQTAVQKAATAPQGKRPGPEEHFESTIIDNEVPALIERPLTLVDDIVTRGASFVGMFRRLTEAFPNRKISCFALIQTVTEGEIDAIIAPIQGIITRYPSGKLWRDCDTGQQQTLL